MMLESDENTFQTDISVAERVAVIFYSENCLPCKTMKEVLEKFSEMYEDIKIYNINVKKERRLAKRYGIQSVPTVIVFEDGQPVAKKFGTLSVSELKKLIIEEKIPQM